MNAQPTDTDSCPCNSGRKFDFCCGQLLSGQLAAASAEALMRSRYTASALHDAEYLLRTWHPDKRPPALSFDPTQNWLGLKIKGCDRGLAGDRVGVVEFVARYKIAGRAYRLHEISRFVKLADEWLYLDGDVFEP